MPPSSIYLQTVMLSPEFKPRPNGTAVRVSLTRITDGRFFLSQFDILIMVVRGALYHGLNSYKDSIWILTDIRSSIQYMKNWPKIMDSTGLDILSKLARLGQRKLVCL
ncbi:RNase H domain-containing protein [Trichonephila clavipes]|nr:RNase H domain-containing protein [Trichonephila clavipes]